MIIKLFPARQYRLINRLIYYIVLTASIASATENSEQIISDNQYKYALLRGLNKVTGKSQILKIPVGEDLYYFETLGLFVRSCQKDLSEDPIENKTLLEVWHKDSTGNIDRVFFGWLFSLRSSISTIEHPVYDIALAECIN
jgi:hypothetical protein